MAGVVAGIALIVAGAVLAAAAGGRFALNVAGLTIAGVGAVVAVEGPRVGLEDDTATHVDEVGLEGHGPGVAGPGQRTGTAPSRVSMADGNGYCTRTRPALLVVTVMSDRSAMCGGRTSAVRAGSLLGSTIPQ